MFIIGSQSTSLPPSPSKGTSSRIAVQTLTPTSPTKPLLTSMTKTATMTTTSSKQQLEPIQMDKMIGIASSAASLRNSILTLRSQLDELRLLQTNQSRNFKTFLNQSMQDFNALAANVAQNVRFGKGLFSDLTIMFLQVYLSDKQIKLLLSTNDLYVHFRQ